MPRVVAVAVSGGRDSLALLHATARAASTLGLQVLALHVHHGLLAQADAWAAHVESTCRRWGVGCAVQRLEGRPARGDSVEGWARRGRYAALAAMAREAGAGLVLLAHHRRDQAETFLLQALRGAGPAGLSAMPRVAERDGITWARPWLDRPSEAVEAYARLHRIDAVQDPSNADPRFARSRLRAAVMPALRQAFGQGEAALADAARRAAEAQAALEEVAAADLPAVSDGPDLHLARWTALPPGRRRNVLRAWLIERTGRAPAQTLLERLLAEAPRAGAARWPAGAQWVRRHRGHLTVQAASAPAAGPPAPAAQAVSIRRAGERAAPGGRLRVTRVPAGGVPLALLAACEWRARRGAERFQRAPGTPPRSLKKQFQAAGVPAWQRDAPLLFSGDTLVFVPGLGLDARVLAAPGEPQVRLEWHR